LDSSGEKPKVFLREATGLVRGISPFDALMINIIIANLVIGSVGLLILPVTFPGVNLVGAIFFAGLASFAVAVVYWLFQLAMPRSGGDYVYTTRVLRPSLGFASNFSWTMWNLSFAGLNASYVASIGLSGLFLVAGTTYNNPGIVSLGNMFGTPNVIFATGTVVSIIAVVIVVAGLRWFLRIGRILLVFSLFGTVAAILLVAFSTNSQFITAFSKYGNYTAVINNANSSGLFPMVGNWSQLIPTVLGIGFASETLLFFTYSPSVGGEIRNTKRAASLSLIGAVIILTGLLLIMAYGMSNTFGSQFLGSIYALFYAGSSQYPLGSVPPSYLFLSGILATNNPILFYAIGIGIIVYIFALAPFFYLTLSRNIMAWSFDRVLPDSLGKVNDRFHSPTNAVIFSFIISEIFMILIVYSATFVQFLAAGTAGSFLTLVLVAVAGIFYATKKKTLYERSGIQSKKVGPVPLIALAGTISVIFLAFLYYGFFSNPGFLLYNPSSTISTLFGYIDTFGIFIGFILFYVLKYWRKTQGIHLDMVFSEIPPE
jgi:amino acid transporter